MVAVTSNPAPSAAVDTTHTAVAAPTPPRRIGLVPTASMITGAVVAVVWLWLPLAILVVGISSIPSVIGFAIAVVVFVYLMRGVEWLARIRSEAVFGMAIGVPPRNMSSYNGFQRWLHQLWLDISSARFWKGSAHPLLRGVSDAAATAIAFALLVFAFIGPAVAIAIRQSDDD